LLWDATIERGFQNPTWMTFMQAKEYGANVRKGEKSSFIVYANKVSKIEKDEQSGDTVEKTIPFLRGYNVFNVEQIEGLPERFQQAPVLPAGTTVERINAVDQFLKNTGAVIRNGGDECYYAEGPDYIKMPHIDAFPDAETYYATLAHEATHWTAHKSRLDRHFGQVTRKDPGYAIEELVAEIGSAFLCADLSISPDVRADHAEYIDHWLQALQNDKKLIFKAAAHATRAVEYLKSKQPMPENTLTVSAAGSSVTARKPALSLRSAP
jgi:antirestriction protein ArdC